ncbi:MAG TPA: hypothetical protein VF621_00400 [Pyrinomonadaceae bacterium]
MSCMVGLKQMLAGACCAALLVAAAAAARAEGGRVAEGLWGGQHVRMSAGEEGARLEFDCARGQIDAPFETDAEGRFDLPGTYTRQGPGPVRVGRAPSARPARYKGRVEGERMTLSVTLEGSDKPLAEYTLTRGSRGNVFKCR